MNTNGLRLETNGGIPRRILLTIIVMATLTVANLHYNVPLLEAIRSDLGITALQANLITVLTQGGYAVGLLFVVALGDLMDARKVIVVNFCILSLALLMMAVGPGIGWLWAAALLTGVSSVAVQMYVPLVSRYSRPQDKGRNVGYVVSGLLVGVLLARTLGGLVGGWTGWRWLYGGVALLMGLCALFTLRLLPSMQAAFRGSYRELLLSIAGIVRQMPHILTSALRSACAFAAFNVLWGCLAFHLAGEPFYAGSQTAGLLGLCGLLTSVAVAGMGKYVDHWGVRRFNWGGFLLMAGAWAVLGWWGHGYAGLIIGIVLLDVGQQCVGVANQSHVLALRPEASSRINTVYMTILFVGGMMGTLAAGLCWTLAGWAGAVGAGLALVMAGAAIGWIGKIK